MTVEVGWGLALGLVLLVALGVAASLAGRMGLARQQVVAAVRAVLQLAVVSLVLAAAVQTLWGAFAFWALMFGVALWTILSLIFHAVRLAQANGRAYRGQPVVSWLG